MADIKKILRKKGWTGRELGILELTNMAVTFRQALAGEKVKPLVEEQQFRQMLHSITDQVQGQTYNGYISIHQWLTVRYNMANGQYQEAMLNQQTLSSYVMDAIFAEDVFRYVAQLPAIMTQKQYDALKHEALEKSFRDDEGQPLAFHLFYLIEDAINHYLELLTKEPKKANPLKAIRKKYLSEPVKSRLILDNYNTVWGEGYYTLEDGSGRRSDQMTPEEWQEAITTPKMRETLARMKATDGSGRELTNALAEERIIERAKVIFAGGTEEDAYKAQRKREHEQGLAVPVKWHTKTEPPELSKWDFIEEQSLMEFYLEVEPDNFTACMKDFVAEFGELVAVILADMEKRYFPDSGLSKLPVEEWEGFTLTAQEMYERDFYGDRERTERSLRYGMDNRRAYFNGVAVLQLLPTDEERIDERGYYQEPPISSTAASFSLEAFFPEAEYYAGHVSAVERAYRSLQRNFYFLRGYNLAIDLIAQKFDVPEISVFKADLDGVIQEIQRYNALIPVCYDTIRGTDYQDKDLQARKLQILRDMFPIIDLDALPIPDGNIQKAVELFTDFKAFRGEKTKFEDLLFIMPEGGVDNED